MTVMSDWSAILGLSAIGISIIGFMVKAFEKNLSIREHEAYKDAVARDIMRIEHRILMIEQTRPTAGELKVFSDVMNSRLEELKSERNRS